MSNQQEIIDGLKLDYSGDEIYQMVDGAIEQILAKKSKEERDSEPDQNKIQRFNDAARVLKQVRDHTSEMPPTASRQTKSATSTIS